MSWNRHHFEYKETVITFLCEEKYLTSAEKALLTSRKILEKYIHNDPLFRTTHSPHHPQKNAPNLIQRMCHEAARVGVGPMATVAAVLAEQALHAILKAGANEAVVDNGGDITLFIRKPVRIGIFAGNSPLKELAFEVEPRDQSFGICTSSGTVGPSFSYGKSDAAVVVSSNVILADAAATALGNRVRDEKNLKNCFSFLKDIEEIEGALVVFRDKVALWGSLPKLVRSRINMDLITRGKSR